MDEPGIRTSWKIIVAAFAAAVTAAACGGGGGGDEPPGDFVIAPYQDDWVGVTGAADGTTVDVLVFGTDAVLEAVDPCYEEYTPRVEEAPDVVSVGIDVGRSTGTDCTQEIRRVTIELDAPAGTRVIENSVTATRYVLGPGNVYLNEAAVNTAGPAEACATEAYQAAAAREIAGATAAGNERCEGQFLVIDVTIKPDDIVNRAYFVNVNGPWRLVTYSPELTCEAVLEQNGAQFPAGVC